MKKLIIALVMLLAMAWSVAWAATEFETALRAAEQGDVEAQAQVGVMYFEGEGTSKNIPKAFDWFQKAALQGHAAAQMMAGIMYYEGVGTPQNYEKAYIYLSLARAAGVFEGIEDSGRFARMLDLSEIKLGIVKAENARKEVERIWEKQQRNKK